MTKIVKKWVEDIEEAKLCASSKVNQQLLKDGYNDASILAIFCGDGV
jgi:hypothetical protein